MVLNLNFDISFECMKNNNFLIKFYVKLNIYTVYFYSGFMSIEFESLIFH